MAQHSKCFNQGVSFIDVVKGKRESLRQKGVRRESETGFCTLKTIGSTSTGGRGTWNRLGSLSHGWLSWSSGVSDSLAVGR